MTDDRPPAAEAATGYDPVLATIHVLDKTAAALEQVMGQVEAGDFGKLDELLKEQAALRRALTAAIMERQHAQKIRRDETARDGGDALDLAAARAEVGRRLARLRAAAAADGGAAQAQP